MYVFFLATVMSRLFFRSFNRLLGDICYDPLDAGLAFKQLSFTRPSERLALDQPIFNSFSGAANDRPIYLMGFGPCGTELDIPYKTSMSSAVGWGERGWQHLLENLNSNSC